MNKNIFKHYFAAIFIIVHYGLQAQYESLYSDSNLVEELKSKTLVTQKNDSLRTIASATKKVYIEGGYYEGEYIESFYMDINLVTVAQYRAAVEAGVCPLPGKNNYWSDTWKSSNDKLPINNISWFNAQTFANWVGKRLPTEKEWEWAARGREEGRIYPWGDEPPKKEDACWMRYIEKDNKGEGACEVGQFPPSRDGVYDLAGNLWEYTINYLDSAKTIIILKGGAWYNDVPDKLKVKYRGHISPYHRWDSSNGIRLVVSAKDYDKVFKE